MGVHGLWKLLEAAGKPVPLETLENKVLAVDVSIWLHQMMKGYQDSRGAPVANAHLLGLFHRVCKLLYYRIKPVFVFDGGVPLLKKQTIAARRKQKAQASQNASEAKERLLKNLVKRKAVRQMLNGSEVLTEEQPAAAPKDDMFELPPLPENALNSESENETEDKLTVFMESGESANESESEPDVKPSSQLLHGFNMDLHSLDVKSEEFLSLPPDVRHDILSELKETRKQNSWGRLHEMPEESGEFSSYQLGRLLKRRNVQVSLENAEKEMGGKVMRITELQELMAAQGVEIIEDSTVIGSSSKRIASDSRTRFVLCKDPTSSALLTSKDSDSSETVEKEGKETENNPLYSEQEEFIALMAENMLQKIVKSKEEKNLCQEKEHKQDIAVADIEVLSGITPNQILLDSWSDDEDVSYSNLSSFKTQKRKPGCTSPGIESNHSSGSVSPPQKALVLHDNDLSGNEDLVKNLLEPKTISNSVPLNKSDSKSATPTKDEQSLFSRDKKSEKESLQVEEKKLEIVVCLGEKPVDDIFADIFQTNPVVQSEEALVTTPEKKTCDSNSKEFLNSISVTNKPLEIVINATGAPEDDDIFADIFQKNDQTKIFNPVKIEADSHSVPEGIEIVSSSESEQDNNRPDSKSFSDARIELIKEEEEEEEEEEKDIELNSHQNLPTFNRANDSSSVSSGEEFDPAGPGSIAPSLSPKLPASSYDLNTMEASLEAENIDLLRERGRQERLAASITDQMCIEAQELLQLFGVPYLVAPMEAEAQCAFLDAISLTEGSITDDSDIWLFGGRKVYKNFFNQKKHVLQFTSSNISHYFKLSREQLIQLALLVGSDYTTGIQGVGPVTAMEIVAAFQCKIESDPIQSALKGLSQFKEWWNTGRPHKSNSMRLLDKKLKNVKFSEGFPSQAVVEAYLRPAVENSEETFSWGALDLPALRIYAKSKFGWTVQKTDEILLPVSKRWSSRTSQRSIDSYFNFQPQLVEGLSKISKRVQKAVTLMGNDEDSDSVDNPDPKPPTSTKRKTSSKKTRASNNLNSKRTKSKRNTVTSDNDVESDVEIDPNHSHGVKSNNSDTADELPVRAPTVPRKRTATGVKRVGLKSSNAHPKSSSESATQFENRGEKKQPSIRDLPKQSAANASSDSEYESGEGEQRTTSKAGPIVRNLQSKKPRKTRVKSGQIKTNVVKDPEEMGTLSNTVSRSSSTKKAIQIQSTSESIHDLPGCTERGSFNEYLDQPSTSAEGASMSSELAALSEMNWEDDPWDAENSSEAFTEQQRPKVFFGGIRPNKPRKPARARTQNPVEATQATDARGVQPGWVTRERMESRTAWVDDMVRRKREENIPQRERDQKAMDDAKMKAIAVVKASGAKRASMLLGRQPSKRGRGKVKLTRKILPEHNLSESSSDE